MDAADDNLALHFSWVQRQTPGMRVRLDEQLSLTDSGLPCDTFNAVCRARLPVDGLAQQVEAAISWFEGRPFSWWVGPADSPAALPSVLASAGLAPAETELAMRCDLTALRVTVPDAGDLHIRRVRTRAELDAFARLLASLATPADPHIPAFYARGSAALLDASSPIRLYLGWLDDEAVATAEATIGGGAVGLYNISVAASCRRLGYGTAMTVEPLLDARDAGQRWAILQAARDGVNVYRRVGFEACGEITEFKPAR